VWRPLVLALAEQVPVRWSAGVREAPEWLAGTGVSIERTDPAAPAIQVVSAGNTYHEAIEALRWMRQLLASGRAAPEQIAIAATLTDEYDSHFLSLRADANLDLHFAHGLPVVATRAGQAAAALADVLVRGLSHDRMRRLATLLAYEAGPLGTQPEGPLPERWLYVLPMDAPLSTTEAWQ